MREPSSSPADVPPTATRLAIDRTRIAYDRTLMAWIRTGTALIAFGFTFYKFFQFDVRPAEGRGPLIRSELIGPREFALVLIGLGLLSVLIGTFEHRRDLKALRKEWAGMPGSGTTYVAALMAVLGLLAFVAVIFRA